MGLPSGMSPPTPGSAMNINDLYAMALGHHILGNPQMLAGLFGATPQATTYPDSGGGGGGEGAGGEGPSGGGGPGGGGGLG